VKVSGLLYTVEFCVGMDPSVVYRIVAPLVLHEIVTFTESVKVYGAAGLNVGVATTISYLPLIMSPSVMPLLNVLAFRVVVVVRVTVRGLLPPGEDDVGLDPSVVYRIVAPLVLHEIVTVTELM
jgi:hypothetical protein